MKKIDWAILINTAAYSFLFYKQSPGINFLLFSILSVAFLIWINPTLMKQKLWILYATAVIFTGTFVFIHGSALATWINIISLLILSAASINYSSSVLINLFFSVYSALSSFIFIIISSFSKQVKEEKNILQKSMVIIFPLFFIIIFFIIYKHSNPLFKSFTKYINLDFINIGWLFFTISGFLLSYGFFKHQRIQEIDTLENSIPLKIDIKEKTSWFNWNEYTAATILFVTLNLMLLFSNALDINYLYLDAKMPEGITHKQFVHNGVGLLILSILIGISLIVFFFRGNLNFRKNNKFLKSLLYLWIFQNLIMIFSTWIRNNIYILDALLTYKRIGVYFWLIALSAGLITTIIKIAKIKTGWYLIKINALIIFLIFTLSTAFDWDKVISENNIGRMNRTNIAPFDKHYLLSLSETNIAALWMVKDKEGFEVDSSYSYRAYYAKSNTDWLNKKLYNFLKKYQSNNWKSYNLRDKRIIKEIKNLYNKGLLKTISFDNREIPLDEYFLLNKNIEEIKPEEKDFQKMENHL